ncbi:Aldo/keto reductase [Earliella scabrosa]|nr:Aldo/keto reductase [Earliella scabrosa]
MSPKMSYVRLGNSGLKVSKIILGCMSYGSKDWMNWVLPEEEAIKHIKYAYDHGITTFDTADMYSNGLSEVILGNAIRKLGLPREELVIMTKLWAPVMKEYGENLSPEQSPEDVGIINQKGLSRKHIFDAVKASLKRLQVDYIDLFQCHRFDPDTPIEETMQALHDVVKAGYVRYIGMSSCWAYECTLIRAHQSGHPDYAINHNLTPFISMQNQYSVLYREEEREMFPTLKMFGVGSIPYSPLGRGLLTRPFKEVSLRKQTDWWQADYDIPFLPELTERIEELAKEKGVSMAQIAMAWVMAKPGVTAPVIGTTSLEKLEDILGSLQVTLTEEEMKYLEEPYRPLKVIGHV